MATTKERQEELSRIYHRDGCLRASVVVNEARDKSSPIHSDFPWNDEWCANQHRLSIARRIIRATPIRSETGVEQRVVHVPVVESIEGPTAASHDAEGVYKTIETVVLNNDELSRALRQLQVQMSAIAKSIREIKGVAGQERLDLLPTLEDAMAVAKGTVKLMLEEAA